MKKKESPIAKIKDAFLLHLSKAVSLFKASLAPKLAAIFLLNLLFTAAAIASINGAKALILNKMGSLDQISLENLGAKSEQELDFIATTARNFLGVLFGSILAAIAMLTAAWSLCQHFIYRIIAGKKATIGKSILLGLLWIPLWLLLFSLILIGGIPQAVQRTLLIAFLLFLHFSFILYARFARTGSFSSIKKAFGAGLRLHHFVIPYALASIPPAVLLLLLSTFKDASTPFRAANIIILVGGVSIAQAVQAKIGGD